MSEAASRAPEPSGQPDQPAWERLARSAARAGETSAAEAPLREFLVMRLADTPYAVPVERVREIVRMRAITPVPRVPDALRGVISLRGEVVQVVDLRRRLGLPAVAPDRDTRIVVMHGDDGTTSGLLVDAVNEVMRVGEDALREESPGGPGNVAALCMRGGAFVSILDLDRVLDLGDGR